MNDIYEENQKMEPYVPPVYTIILSDGTELADLGLNGNNLVSKTPLTKADFEGKLNEITVIENGNNLGTYQNVKLAALNHYEDGYYFVLIKMTETELFQRQVLSSLDYIAMMTDVEL